MNKNTKFLPGTSGNPAGRKKGNATAQKLRQAIADDIGDVIDVLMKQAKNGDVASAKLLMDRAVPTLRPVSEAIVINSIPDDNTAEIGRLIIDATLRGELAPDVSSQLLTGLASQVRIEEYTLLEARISQLENGGSHG
jgi:hypothetical protein